MPLQKLQFRPGVNREGTTLSNEGGWFDCDKIRFRSGYPEKIGGWQADGGTIYATSPTGTFSSGGTSTAVSITSSTGLFWGIAKSLWNWINLSGYNLMSVGTNLKFYIQNSSGGAFNDVTPIRLTTAAGTPTFAATNGSATIVVTCSGHGAQTNDFVTFSAAASLGGNITAAVLNREYQITSVTSNNTFTITATATANGSDTGTGGASTVANFQLTTGYTTFTLGTGWGAGGWGGSTGPAFSTSINGGTAVTASSTTAITVVSTSGFAASGTIYIGSEGITYTSTTGTTFAGTITRGVNSTAAAHANGSAVYQYASSGTNAATGWGSPATTGIGIQLRLWSQTNYGEDLIFNPRGGAMYYWSNNASPNVYDRAQIIKASTSITVKGGGTITPDYTCPSVANFVLVSDSSRFVFAFGTNDPSGYTTGGVTTQNPLLVRWSNQQDVATWLPSISNQAGSVTLSHGSVIVTAIQTRQEILVLTDAAIYSFQYLGAPYVWGNQILADNISIVSPNAAAVVNNVTYWMGADKFYMYSGRVETLPCALRQYIYGNINLTEAFQIHCGTNEGYNEIWWFYPSQTGTTADGQNGTGTAGSPNALIDRYVIYNHLERTWYYGTLNGVGGTVDGITYGAVRPRTAWLDSPLRAEPTAAIGYNSSGAYLNGALVYHETTVDNNEVATSPAAINAYVQSSDFDIGDGHNFGFVWRLIPDLTFDGSSTSTPGSAPYPVAYFTVRPRQNPGANYGSSDDPTVTGKQSYAATTTYNVQQFTQQVYVRIRGRQMAFKIESLDIGVQWQLGAPRIDVRPDGRR
jgi:hypothetical protein